MDFRIKLVPTGPGLKYSKCRAFPKGKGNCAYCRETRHPYQRELRLYLELSIYFLSLSAIVWQQMRAYTISRLPSKPGGEPMKEGDIVAWVNEKVRSKTNSYRVLKVWFF